MLKKIVVGIGSVLALAILIVLGIASTKPAKFHVERSTTVSAPPQAVFANIEDFHRWAEWSPWEKLDANMKKTYGGATRGVGATYAWSGNDEVGAGKMTILEASPGDHVLIKLEFLKPFASTNVATYSLKPSAGGTEVTWAMDGPNAFMGKVMSVFMDFDAMIGKDFERGLENLKRVSETTR